MKPSLTKAQAEEAVKQHGSQRAAARALGFKSHKAISTALKSTSPATPIRRKSRGLSREQFAATFDNDTRIRNLVRLGIKTLDNSDEILEDAQFRVERCRKAPTSGWRKITEEPEFVKFRFEAKGKIFWTTQTTKLWALENIEGAKE